MILFPFRFSFYILSFHFPFFYFQFSTAFFKLLNLFIFNLVHITFSKTFVLVCMSFLISLNYYVYLTLLTVTKTFYVFQYYFRYLLQRLCCLDICVWLFAFISVSVCMRGIFYFCLNEISCLNDIFHYFVIIKVDCRLSLLFQIQFYYELLLF